MAKANPFRFSTKYQDDETDLLYYGYRYYNASTGRWLSRDPIAENGGENLYAVWRNDYINKFDLFGLCACSLSSPSGAGNPARDARALCQQSIDAVKKDGAPRELPDDHSCAKCPKELSDLQKNPSPYWVKKLFDQFGKDCPVPPIRCVRCSGAGGWYDPNRKEIVVCHNEGTFSSLADTLAHELTHALQDCYRKSHGCKDSLKKEMEAYFCSHEAFQFGDVYSDAVRSSCGTSPSQCTPDEVQKFYPELQEWFNKERENFCKFPRKPDYPGPSTK